MNDEIREALADLERRIEDRLDKQESLMADLADQIRQGRDEVFYDYATKSDFESLEGRVQSLEYSR